MNLQEPPSLNTASEIWTKYPNDAQDWKKTFQIKLAD